MVALKTQKHENRKTMSARKIINSTLSYIPSWNNNDFEWSTKSFLHLSTNKVQVLNYTMGNLPWYSSMLFFLV